MENDKNKIFRVTGTSEAVTEVFTTAFRKSHLVTTPDMFGGLGEYREKPDCKPNFHQRLVIFNEK